MGVREKAPPMIARRSNVRVSIRRLTRLDKVKRAEVAPLALNGLELCIGVSRTLGAVQHSSVVSLLIAQSRIVSTKFDQPTTGVDASLKLELAYIYTRTHTHKYTVAIIACI